LTDAFAATGAAFLGAAFAGAFLAAAFAGAGVFGFGLADFDGTFVAFEAVLLAFAGRVAGFA
jgi:hypothetical protein